MDDKPNLSGAKPVAGCRLVRSTDFADHGQFRDELQRLLDEGWEQPGLAYLERRPGNIEVTCILLVEPLTGDDAERFHWQAD